MPPDQDDRSSTTDASATTDRRSTADTSATDSPSSNADRPPTTTSLDRRRFLRSAGLLGAGVAAGGAVGGALGVALDNDGRPAARQSTTGTGSGPVPFHGAHQAGITGHPPAYLRMTSWDLSTQTLSGGRRALAALLAAITSTAEPMTGGRWAPGQLGAADGLRPAGLTITVAVGQRLVRAAGATVPQALQALPAFPGEQLDPARGGGDLAVTVCADDPQVVSSAASALAVIIARGAAPRWTQSAFLPSRAASDDPAATARNLLGQKDGTDNPTGSRLDLAVWVPPGSGPDWAAGGTYQVCRRIRMLLGEWSKLTRQQREATIGRTLDTGAPLSGGTEHTSPDFAAAGDNGAKKIPADAHIRLTHPSQNAGATMLRRSYSYDDGMHSDGSPDAGLFFQCYQTDPHQVFVPIQRRLATSDALRRVIRHEASASFFVLPGARPGEFLGQRLVAS